MHIGLFGSHRLDYRMKIKSHNLMLVNPSPLAEVPHHWLSRAKRHGLGPDDPLANSPVNLTRADSRWVNKGSVCRVISYTDGWSRSLASEEDRTPLTRTLAYCSFIGREHCCCELHSDAAPTTSAQQQQQKQTNAKSKHKRRKFYILFHLFCKSRRRGCSLFLLWSRNKKIEEANMFIFLKISMRKE